MLLHDLPGTKSSKVDNARAHSASYIGRTWFIMASKVASRFGITRSLAINTLLRSCFVLHDRRGASIVEFAIVAPVFLLFLFGVFGAGLDALYQEMLDDAVRDAARQVQMAGPAANSSNGFVSAVCAQLSVLAQDCSQTLSYSVKSSTSGFSNLTLEDLNNSGNYSNKFFSDTNPGVNVLIQVAYPLPFDIPILGNALTGTTTNTIVSATTVQIEPYK